MGEQRKGEQPENPMGRQVPEAPRATSPVLWEDEVHLEAYNNPSPRSPMPQLLGQHLPSFTETLGGSQASLNRGCRG